MDLKDVKPGVEVRVLRNRTRAWHPILDRPIEAGDVVTLTGDYQWRVVADRMSVDYDFGSGFVQETYIEDVELFDPEPSRLCQCPSANFGWNGIGCHCGGR